MFFKALLFGAVIVAIAAENGPENTPCTPGSNFKHYCNSCRCADDGTGAACTRMACPPELFNKDGSNKFDTETTTVKAEVSTEAIAAENGPGNTLCTPRSSFKHYCNTCRCADDGKGAAYCTMMACDPEIFNKDGSNKFDTETTTMKAEISTEAIAAGNGPENTPCTPGSSFKHYCNFCRCAADGKGAGCTRMWCDLERFNKDGSPKFHTETTTMKTEVSTEAAAVEKGPENTPCIPRSSFKHYCNTCWCAIDGSGAGCTKMACPPEIFNKDGSIKRDTETTTMKAEVYPEAPTDGTCVAGKMYKMQCNTCRCFKKNQLACTMMACP